MSHIYKIFFGIVDDTKMCEIMTILLYARFL